MNNEQSGQTKTEQPTEKKLAESKRKGQVARSRELNTAIVMLFSSLVLIFSFRSIAHTINQQSIKLFDFDDVTSLHNNSVVDFLGGSLLTVLVALIPFLVLCTIFCFMGPLLLGGWTFSSDNLKPKFNRLNPLSGLKRMFGLVGFVESIKAIAKFLVISVVASTLSYFFAGEILTLGSKDIVTDVNSGFYTILIALVLLSASLFLIAFIDVPYQLISHFNKLKMTKQEIKEENKQTTGSPEVRNQVRNLQREISSRRMLQDVSTADVVIVNPTHYSVALKYDDNSMSAPVVVAKGVDHIALRIREIASDNNVEVFAAPALARLLYGSSRVGQEVPSDLYHAVAQVLAYIYQIKALSERDKFRIKKPKISLTKRQLP